MTVEGTLQNNGQVSFYTRSYCYQGACSLVGPTLELIPGDTFSLTVTNNLGANPSNEDTTMNSMHSPNNTNLHTHGLHIDPNIDTIFALMHPGETHTYVYEVPADHAPGTHWYHDHAHGSSTLKVMGGLVGAVIIRPSGAENIPASISSGEEHLLVISQLIVAQAKDADGYVSQGCGNGITCDPDTQPPDCTAWQVALQSGGSTFSPFRVYSYRELSAATGSEMDAIVSVTDSSVEDPMFFINGQYQPTISISQDSTVTLRIVAAYGGDRMRFELRGGECTMSLIAVDGVYRTDVQSKAKVYLMAGSRADVQVRCSRSGTTDLAAEGMTIGYIEVSGTASSYASTTSAELAAIVRPGYLDDLSSATADVDYSVHMSQGSRPIAECGGADLFWFGAGSDCSSVSPWGSEEPSSSSSECPFGFFEGQRGADASAYTNANKLALRSAQMKMPQITSQ
eukprot:gene11476-13561_t